MTTGLSPRLQVAARPAEDYEDKSGEEDQEGWRRWSRWVPHRLVSLSGFGGSAAKRWIRGKKNDDDYGNEQSSLSERLNGPLIAFT